MFIWFTVVAFAKIECFHTYFAYWINFRKKTMCQVNTKNAMTSRWNSLLLNFFFLQCFERNERMHGKYVSARDVYAKSETTISSGENAFERLNLAKYYTTLIFLGLAKPAIKAHSAILCVPLGMLTQSREFCVHVPQTSYTRESREQTTAETHRTKKKSCIHTEREREYNIK